MDRPTNYEHVDPSEASLYNTSTLILHGLLYDHASFRYCEPPSPLCFPSCNAALTDPL